jgi:hypothetical protein
MASLSEQIAALEQQRIALQRQLEEVSTRLSRIKVAFEPGAAGAVSAPAKSAGPKKKLGRPAKAKAAAPAVKATAPAAKAKGRRQWFGTGEAIAIASKVLKKPMTQADLVRAFADAKGYSRQLSKAEMKKFQGAAYTAIAQGVKDRKLVKAANGMVSLRR